MPNAPKILEDDPVPTSIELPKKTKQKKVQTEDLATMFEPRETRLFNIDRQGRSLATPARETGRFCKLCK